MRARARPRRSRRRTPRSPAARLVRGVAHAEAAAEVPDRELARALASSATALRNGSRSSSCEPMCACSPRSSSPSTRSIRAIASRDLGHREAELRVGLAGRDLLRASRPRTSGRDAHQHRLAPRARRARPRRSAAAQALDLVEVVDHDQPDAVASAMRSSASDLALPCSTMRSGRKARAQREVQLAARCDVAPEALLRRTARRTAVQGKAFEANTTCEVARGRARARPRGTRARGRAGRPRRRRTPGVPNSRGELDHVAAADLEPAALVQPAAERKDVRRGSCPVAIARDYGRCVAERLAGTAHGPSCHNRGGTPPLGSHHRATFQSFGRDTGLQARMLLTLFLLGLVYVVFVGVLFAAGAGAGVIVVVAVVLLLAAALRLRQDRAGDDRRVKEVSPAAGARAARDHRAAVRAGEPAQAARRRDRDVDAERLRDGPLAEVGDRVRDARDPRAARRRPSSKA